MKVRRQIEFHKAKHLLGLGYPQKYVATVVGVHPNSVWSWAKKLGLSASSGNRGRSRRISSLWRRIQRLPVCDRDELFRMISRKVA